MTLLVSVLAILITLAIVTTLGLVVARPGVFDRIIGVGVVGTKTTVLLVFTGIVFDRPSAFVDIALTYAFLNFVVTLAVAKYVTKGEPVR